MVVKRGEREVDLQFVPAGKKTEKYRVTEDPASSEAQKMLRALWLAGKTVGE
jgi:hypothetical protein